MTLWYAIINIIIAISLSAQSFSMQIADIDVVDFPMTIKRRQVSMKEGRQHPYDKQNPEQEISFTQYLRIVFFDHDTQEFVNRSIYYLPILFQTQPYSIVITFPQWFTVTYTSHSQQGSTLDLSLFTPETSFSRSSKVIRCNTQFLQNVQGPSYTPLDLGLLGISDETRPNLNRIWYMTGRESPFPQCLNLQSINEFLNRLEGREKDRNIFLRGCFYFSEYHDLTGPASFKECTINFTQKGESPSLREVKGRIGSKEKGRIGELAADITMQCFGFSKRNGKYGGGKDNGFDGIYCRDDALFISDSKFFSATPNLLSVLNQAIYATIETRLANIEFQGSPQAKQSAAHVRAFMIHNPHHVFLLPYVVLPDGKVKTLVRPFRTVHAALDPSRRTEMLETIFSNLKIVPQNTTGLQTVHIDHQSQLQQISQISTQEAYQCIHYLMQSLGMHAEYRLVRHEDIWQPITPESLRNPQIRLLENDLIYFGSLIAQVGKEEQKGEVERVMGEIADTTHQHQVLELLDIILGPRNEKVGNINIGEYLPWLIRNLSTSLKPTTYELAKHLAHKTFPYKPNSYNLFNLNHENHMVIFETFLLSPYLLDESLWERCLLQYYLVHGSLCHIEIEPEDTAPYLYDYVNTFSTYQVEELVNIIKLVHNLYDSECYLNLKGSHDCEDWFLLVQALLPLPLEQREMIVNFMENFPRSFNYGPADAIEALKPLITLVEELEAQDLLDSTDALFNKVFAIYDDPSAQNACLEIIMRGVKAGKCEEKIMKDIRDKIL